MKSKPFTIEDLESKGFQLAKNGQYEKLILTHIAEQTITAPILGAGEVLKILKTKRPKAIVKRIPNLKPIENGIITMFIKPLSVNQAWQGKRFKTPKYIKYEQELLASLPPMEIPPPPYEIYFKFGFSSASSDWDNCIKQAQDILAKKYGFNDKLIKRGVVDIENVEKGAEFFEFKIKTLVK